jgi:hypothetical protein
MQRYNLETKESAKWARLLLPDDLHRTRQPFGKHAANLVALADRVL